jgi:hypothetical protein
MRLADIDNTNKGNSHPPTNPFGIIMIVEPIISIIKRIPAILVRTPISNECRLLLPIIQLVMPLQLANQPHVKISG